MVIERRIKLTIDRCYYIGVELKYNNEAFLVKMDDSYFDMGDFSYLINHVENAYEKKDYLKDSIAGGYLNDIFYIYNHFPFLSYIKEISYTSENKISLISIINKEEILNYIDKFNITLEPFDGKKSVCPLLF